MARFRSKPSLRDTLAANERMLKFMSPDGKLPPDMQRTFDKDRLPPKRIYRPSVKREALVLKTIIDGLRKHPAVARVVRNQSGVFHDGDRTIKVGYRGKPDLTVYLRNGRWGEIEVKAAGQRPTEAQARQLQRTKAAGGFIGIARSLDDALTIIALAG